MCRLAGLGGAAKRNYSGAALCRTGVKMRVYIWMEGTDADCINNEAAEDPATYNVNVKLAGISAE